MRSLDIASFFFMASLLIMGFNLTGRVTRWPRSRSKCEGICSCSLSIFRRYVWERIGCTRVENRSPHAV
jgi:hypothetical protein